MISIVEAEQSLPPPIMTAGVWRIAIFTCTYLAAAAIAAVVTGNREFVFYIAVMVLLLAVVAIVHRRVRLSELTLAALSLWGLAHMAGGLVPVPKSWPIDGDIRVLYSWWIIPGLLKYDQVVHAYGFGVTAWGCWQGLASAIGQSRPNECSVATPTFGLLALCATSAMGFGALNEVIEFAATLIMPKTNVGGYVNTGWDLVSNAAGASIAAVLIWLSARRTAHPTG